MAVQIAQTINFSKISEKAKIVTLLVHYDTFLETLSRSQNVTSYALYRPLF
ncbi:hypothetical protein ALT721_290022 [Alteromonas alvinellae]